jgi:hypothetical protein
MTLRDVPLQIGQAPAMIVFSPLPRGFIHWPKERIQRPQGSGIFRPPSFLPVDPLRVLPRRDSYPVGPAQFPSGSDRRPSGRGPDARIVLARDER